MGRKNITVDIAANEIGVTKQHVYALIKAGRLTAIDISVSGTGGPQSLRIVAESVRNFISDRTIDPEGYFQ